MALTAFCPTCRRTVYLEDDDTAVCPVCSSPLLETVETGADERDAGPAGDPGAASHGPA